MPNQAKAEQKALASAFLLVFLVFFFGLLLLPDNPAPASFAQQEQATILPPADTAARVGR